MKGALLVEGLLCHDVTIEFSLLAREPPSIILDGNGNTQQRFIRPSPWTTSTTKDVSRLGA